MDLNEKIRRILAEKNISPSHFADEIGIQRSSVSHIMAGRNKPSLDIVQKIIRRFPDLGMNWILDDEDLPEIAAESLAKPAKPEVTQPKEPERASQDPNVLHSDTATIQAVNPTHENLPIEVRKKIERVMIFYSDGTFEEYKPQGD
jgi:transcriptional regulator with XRE-family HTH domain